MVAHCVVVLTGGKGRIEHAVVVMKQHDAKRLLVSGTDPVVTKADLSGSHNTVYAVDGAHVYLAGLKSPLLRV